jgi:hypothetical protein
MKSICEGSLRATLGAAGSPRVAAGITGIQDSCLEAGEVLKGRLEALLRELEGPQSRRLTDFFGLPTGVRSKFPTAVTTGPSGSRRE